jgi:hypothetical protein
MHLVWCEVNDLVVFCDGEGTAGVDVGHVGDCCCAVHGDGLCCGDGGVHVCEGSIEHAVDDVVAGDVEDGGAVEVCEGDRDFNGDCAVVIFFPARRNVMGIVVGVGLLVCVVV